MVALGAVVCAHITALMTAQGCGFVVFLQGNLGMGKTTLVRGMMRHFGYEGAVKSPTYTLVEPYYFQPICQGVSQPVTITVNHFDLYRLMDKEELEYIGIRDYFGQGILNLIEWPDRGEGLLPVADLVISIDGNATQRTLILNAPTQQGVNLLVAMDKAYD